MAKLAYKLVGTLISLLGGVVASALFKRLWKLLGHEDEAPSATARKRGWVEILAAGALQGAIVGVVRAGLDRSGAVGFRKATGEWPVEE